ncbi:hypothetical protein MAR_011545 [Mya arenaria]|uniref:B box-type domain-containing protein n=1 Tax=Mya arenaria TaxID=6604 RepID=A0ABY7G3H2_MYAAR|nr:hypothetical protein MAR_011545 [Mya arenaria]
MDRLSHVTYLVQFTSLLIRGVVKTRSTCKFSQNVNLKQNMASKFESSIQRDGDFIYDFTCSPCEENGLNTEAQHFCKECSKYYCNKCAPVHNTLYNRHTVFGRKDLDNWAGSTTTITNAVEICERHPGKSLELVCDDHDQLCCHVCIAVDHRPLRYIMMPYYPRLLRYTIMPYYPKLLRYIIMPYYPKLLRYTIMPYYPKLLRYTIMPYYPKLLSPVI